MAAWYDCSVQRCTGQVRADVGVARKWTASPFCTFRRTTRRGTRKSRAGCDANDSENGQTHKLLHGDSTFRAFVRLQAQLKLVHNA